MWARLSGGAPQGMDLTIAGIDDNLLDNAQ